MNANVFEETVCGFMKIGLEEDLYDFEVGFEMGFEGEVGLGPVEEVERDLRVFLGVLEDLEEVVWGEVGRKIGAFEELNPVFSLQED